MATYLDDTAPADIDAVTFGALAIRSLKTALNTVIGKIFDSTGAFLPNWITSSMFAAGAVTAPALGAGAVTAPALGAGAVTAPALGAGAVTDAAVGAASVNASKLIAASITATQIAPATITSTQIAPLTITDALIAAATLTNDKSVAGENGRLRIRSVTLPGTSSPVTVNIGFTPDAVWLVTPTQLNKPMAVAVLAEITGVIGSGGNSPLHPVDGTLSVKNLTWTTTGFTIPAGNPYGDGAFAGVLYYIAFKE